MSCNKTRLAIPALAGALAAAAALSACQYDPHPEVLAKAQQLLPTEQFQVKVTSRPEQIALQPYASGPSANQEAALAQFVSQWRDDGGGVVSLRGPSDGADPRAAHRMVDQTAAYLIKLGVPRERLRVMGYVSGRAPGAPVVASYDRFEALGPNCSGGWKDLTTTGGNGPYDHFGCAVTANFAAQIANPRDLLAPAVVTPADDTRREVVLGKYRRGETTSASADDQANAKASQSTN